MKNLEKSKFKYLWRAVFQKKTITQHPEDKYSRHNPDAEWNPSSFRDFQNYFDNHSTTRLSTRTAKRLYAAPSRPVSPPCCCLTSTAPAPYTSMLWRHNIRSTSAAWQACTPPRSKKTSKPNCSTSITTFSPTTQSLPLAR